MNVSVIIPNKNGAAYLERALISIQRQTVPAKEIVIADYFSTDDSQKIAYQYGVRWIPVTRRGIAAGRNVAIQAAVGDFILPLDSDDWIAPDYIAHCLPKLQDFSVGVVATDLVWPNGTVQKPKQPFTTSAFVECNRIFTCSMFRKAAWARVNGYREDLDIFEDRLFWGMLAAHWRIEYVPKPLFHYCPHPNGSCGRMQPGAEACYSAKTRAMLTAYLNSLTPAVTVSY